MNQNAQEKILGIDYGDKRIGLAESEILDMAFPIGTYQSKGMRADVDYFTRLIREKQYSFVVIGLPLNMDGSEGERAAKTRKFGSVLQKAASVKVEYVDERLTTVEAHRLLDEIGIKYEKHEKTVDAVSAQLILQTFLDSELHRNQR